MAVNKIEFLNESPGFDSKLNGYHCVLSKVFCSCELRPIMVVHWLTPSKEVSFNTAVEHMPHEPEVVGSNICSLLGFFLFKNEVIKQEVLLLSSILVPILNQQYYNLCNVSQ